MSRRKKRLIALLPIVAVTLVVAAIALAQASDGDSGNSGANPETGQRGIGVPKGPFVDFCPTPEQTQAHLEKYDFDYKPTVACSRQGEVGASSTSGVAKDNLTAEEQLQRDVAVLRSAKPLPDSDGDPTTIEGELPDGSRFSLDILAGDPERFKGMTPAEFAALIEP